MHLDLEFIRRATRVTSFNLSESDFTSTRYKDEIRHIFQTHLIPELEEVDYANSIDMSLNSKIAVLKRSPNFMNLYNYKMMGIGPGEIMLYVLVKDARLGGAGSAGKDIMVGGTGYEVKAAGISGDRRFAKDFTTGGTIKEIPTIISKMQLLAKSLNISISGNEISQNTLKLMKQRAPEQYQAIDIEYGEAAGRYFAGHDTVFMNNSGGGKSMIGNVAAVKRVMPTDISMYHITRGNIKPLVRL